MAGTFLLWLGLSILVVITDPAFLKGHMEEYIVASPAGFAFVAAFTRSREIGARLYIIEGTVKNHISSVLSKLQLRDRTQAVLFAKEQGLI